MEPRSTGGGILKIGYGDRMNVMKWWSKRQATVAKSTAESELVAMSLTAREARGLELFAQEIFGKFKVSKGGDNAASISIVKCDASRKKVMLLELNHFFICECRKNMDMTY